MNLRDFPHGFFFLRCLGWFNTVRDPYGWIQAMINFLEVWGSISSKKHNIGMLASYLVIFDHFRLWNYEAKT